MDRIGKKTDSRVNREVEPVCRFGPGGDFVSDWPPRFGVSPQRSSSRVRKLLKLVSEIITAALGSELNVPSGVGPSGRRVPDKTFTEEERVPYGIENNKGDEWAYATATAIIESGRRFQGEPMLFADDWGAGGRNRRKPKYGIRAYRRAAKKRSGFSLSGQGSLFETGFKSARTA